MRTRAPRRALWPALAVLVLGAPVASADDPPLPRNILIVVADDLGVDMVGAYGQGANPPPTPNLDQLAADGLRFDNAWTHPYCSPTRASLQTGRYGFRTGIGDLIDAGGPSLPLDEVTLPEMLDLGTGGGYERAAFGKWHLSNATVDSGTGLPVDPDSGGLLNPNLQGYTTYAGALYNLQCGLPLCSLEWWSGPFPYDYFHWPKVVDGVEGLVDVYATTDTVDDALAWIADATEPWLCYVALHAPHAPFQAPPAHLNSSGLTPGEIAVGDPRPYYGAMVEALDTEVGRLVLGIPKGPRRRTTVFFLGDNGTPASMVEPPFEPSHAKGTVYQGGINVPFIVKSPLLVANPGRSTDALVDVTDVFATVAELAGVDLDATLPPGTVCDGKSLMPYMVDPLATPIRDYVFSEVSEPNVILPFCQTDEGLGGPGAAALSVCGEMLFEGNTADFTLSSAPAGSSAWIIVSQTLSPTPFKGGVLGPVPIEGVLGPVVTDASGEVSFPIPGGTGDDAGAALYVQVVVQDAARPNAYTLSNTVHVRWPPEEDRYRVVAVRDDAFKLIRVLHDNTSTVASYGPGTPTLFYDLVNDPLEQNELLQSGPLTSAQQSAFDALETALDALLGAP